MYWCLSTMECAGPDGGLGPPERLPFRSRLLQVARLNLAFDAVTSLGTVSAA